MFEIVFLFANFLWHQNAKYPIFAYYITHERVAAAVKRHKPKKKEKERDQRKAFSSFRFLFSAFDFRTICLHTICLQNQSVLKVSLSLPGSLIVSTTLRKSYQFFSSLYEYPQNPQGLLKYHWVSLKDVLGTILQKLSNCEVRTWLWWNLVISPPLRFYDFTWNPLLVNSNSPKMSFFAILETQNFEFW